MAEKEVEEKTADSTQVKHNGAVVMTKRRQMWVIWTVIVGFVVLILLVVAAIVVAHKVTETANANNTTRPSLQVGQRRIGYGGYPSSSFYQQSSSTDGPTTTTTTTKYTVTEGVVTQVNSGSIVVAGNGKTQTITTNSSTTYDNGTKPAVNDTVEIEGTADSSGTVTATEIAVADSTN